MSETFDVIPSAFLESLKKKKAFLLSQLHYSQIEIG
jgi:hypothetical protein